MRVIRQYAMNPITLCHSIRSVITFTDMYVNYDPCIKNAKKGVNLKEFRTP